MLEEPIESDEPDLPLDRQLAGRPTWPGTTGSFAVPLSMTMRPPNLPSATLVDEHALGEHGGGRRDLEARLAVADGAPLAAELQLAVRLRHARPWAW